MKFNFEIKGKVPAESLDDAIDMLQLILEDNQIVITRLSVGNKYVGAVSSIGNKKVKS